MRILYDLWASQPLQGKYHGGGTHALAVLEGLVAERSSESISVFCDGSRWLDPGIQSLLRAEKVPIVDVRDKRSLQSLLDSGRFDRLYSSLPYDLFDLDLGAVDFLFTVHGIRQLEMPGDRFEFRYADGFRRRAKTMLRHLALPVYVKRQKAKLRRLLTCPARSKTVFVPSLHTKHALLHEFRELGPSDVCVAYSPARRPRNEAPDHRRGGLILREYRVDRRGYFLLLNAGRWIKNAYRALLALDGFFERHPDVNLRVVVLGVERGQQLHRHVRHSSRFTFRGYVQAEPLQVLYREAFAFVYPTLNEGFGYPPLEAMRCGTPVICSAVTSLPEVCGDAALYCDPSSVDEIRNRISQLVLEQGLWDHYSARGQSRWQEVGRLQQEGLTRICRAILRCD